MTEAVRAVMDYVFQVMKVRLLTINHYTINARSRRVIEKCGFKPEGVVPWACKRFDGKICDDVCYSILREDYINGLGTNLQDQL